MDGEGYLVSSRKCYLKIKRKESLSVFVRDVLGTPV